MDLPDQKNELESYVAKLQEQLHAAEDAEQIRIIEKEIIEVEEELKDLEGMLSSGREMSIEERTHIWERTRRLRSSLPFILTALLSFAPFMGDQNDTRAHDLTDQVTKWVRATGRMIKDIEEMSEATKPKKDGDSAMDAVFLDE